MKKIIIRAACLLALIGPSSPSSFSFAGVIYAQDSEMEDVTQNDISNYLTSRGYTLESTPVQYEYNWTVYTAKDGKHYLTTVYTNGYIIVSHEDILI